MASVPPKGRAKSINDMTAAILSLQIPAPCSVFGMKRTPEPPPAMARKMLTSIWLRVDVAYARTPSGARHVKRVMVALVMAIEGFVVRLRNVLLPGT